MPVKNLMQQRRGDAATWTSVNPVLAAGEIGVETDTLKMKVGNGTAAWDVLEYTTDWSNLTSVPSTFAPSAHSHAISDVTSLQGALDGKAATVHTHVKADITDFAHTHLLADITDYTPPVIPEVTFTNTLMLMGA